MNRLDVRLIPGAERLLELHAAELPQKNELCGAFWGTLALRLAGVTGSGAPIDQDAVGVLAGSALAETADEELPPGESGRADYRITFPVIADSARAGTSAGGLVRALQELAGETLAITPVAGPWTPAAVTAVLDAAIGCREPCTVIANLSTRHLWGGRPSPAVLLRYLMSGDHGSGPPADWDVGHFVGVLGRVEGPQGTLVLIGDTYRSLGWEGIHPQPVERLSDALGRVHTGRPSGVILVTGADEAAGVERQLDVAGLQVGTWDNGSLDMAGAAG